MRKDIRKFVGITAATLPIREPIYEFGAFQVPGQEELADLRPLFPGLQYVGADMREGTGVDKVLDLHSIDLPSESVASVLCLDTLEHVEYPHQALKEIYRILSPTCGIAVISSVMDFPIHDYPYDYWRFTPTAFESLLKPFKHSFVGFAGNDIFPHTVVGVGFKGDCPDLTIFKEKYRLWQKSQMQDIRYIIRRATPPVLFPLLIDTYAKLLGFIKPGNRKTNNQG